MKYRDPAYEPSLQDQFDMLRERCEGQEELISRYAVALGRVRLVTSDPVARDIAQSALWPKAGSRAA